MMKILAGLLAGLIFGGGLALSRMVDPGKVLDFLDIWALPSAGWDPSLAFVMAGALAVTGLGYLVVRRRGQPLFDSTFQIPTGRHIDGRLVGGAALFGLGWGLVGYCPGPAIAGLAYGKGETLIFVAAMLAGMGLYRLTQDR